MLVCPLLCLRSRVVYYSRQMPQQLILMWYILMVQLIFGLNLVVMCVLHNLLTLNCLLRPCPTTPAWMVPLWTDSSFAFPKCWL